MKRKAEVLRHRIFGENDSRVNAGYMSIKEYLLLFFAVAAINGFHMVIYQEFVTRGIMETHVQLVINILMGYVVLMAALLMALIALVRHVSWNRPMRRLSEAARNIAQGDFSARIAPRRKDGKKDFVEVMFDDFNTMARELESIEIMKNDFIANVSHEIKSPLSVIQSYATALQNEKLEPEERHEYIKTIVSSSQKLSTLVSNILKLNKLENQKILPAASCYVLSEQLRRCALALEDLWEQKNINFEADLDEITVSYDENMLEIVWNNLIANAIKFTAPGGTIAMSLKKAAGGFAWVQITDSGCGMDEETQKRIFDKFYQGDSSHSQEGNGLGLALVKKVIDMTGAEITVISRVGEGTTFTVCLKIAKKV
ncbi:HAMP domain-containing histidine kinase [Treponema primitia]|uniref:HAMP domain-containing sensor histidine kinase n=1 Tax=Treponema primitia TaxID=88058 RepID=UPI00398108EF